MSELIIVSGAYGVGKSEFAAQYACQHAPCALADLDLINPYFRPREQARWLAQHGVDILGIQRVNHINQDFPALSGNIAQALHAQQRLILDCAGSEQGLRPLKSFAPLLTSAKLWLVVNLHRPESSLDEVETMRQRFEAQLGLNVDGLIHNTHLLDETNLDDLRAAQVLIEAFALRTQLPIRYTMIKSTFKDALKDVIHTPILTFERLILRQAWMQGGTS
jgi:hypothetical protein